MSSIISTSCDKNILLSRKKLYHGIPNGIFSLLLLCLVIGPNLACMFEPNVAWLNVFLYT